MDPTPPPVTPEGPITVVPSNLNGTSRLGGLSLNPIHGRAFIRGLIASSGLDAAASDAFVEPVVDFLLAQVPQGILPKAQIRQILTATQPSSIFQGDEAQIDPENFGNAIAPDLAEFIYTNVPNVTKYLASDNMNVYVRVPSALEGGSVKFRLNSNQMIDGQRITPAEFQADTIPYTFRLEERLAATNLPAWPDLGNQLFSGVVLRYSQTGLDGDYIAVDMDPVPGDNGVVWESEIGILPKGSTYYYFEVTLAEPVKLEIINRDALAELLASPDGTTTVPATREYIINSWSMPDPRNLQLSERGIFDALFTSDVVAEIVRIAAPLIVGIQSGETTGIQVDGRDLIKLQNLLLRNANKLTSGFESNYDPLLASVFSVPKVDIATHSLWYTDDFGFMADGGYNLEAVVYNANGDAVDSISVDFTKDTTAPEAIINVGPANANTTGYWNKDSIFVATAPGEGASILNITSTPTADSKLASGFDLMGQDGYLIYQIIGLDKDGNPETTWLPLTVENSMLASDIWDIAKEQLPGLAATQADPTIKAALELAAGLDLEAVLGIINPALIHQLASPFFMGLGITYTEEHSAKIHELLGAVIADINMIPLTSDPTRVMSIPIQGDQLPLLLGDIGVRAMGIDTLFNVGSHVPPTRIKVVMPEWDRTSIIHASLGDLNGDGDAGEPYESGKLYKNATEVTLSVAINDDGRSTEMHPATIMVQYKDANGDWQNIGELDIAEGADTITDPPTVTHDFTDFADLVMADSVVNLRTVTTNGLQLSDKSEMFTLELVDDVHPVDPKVLVVDVDESSIMMTNPDSGAPQGTISLIAYTPRVTYPDTTSIQLDVKRASDDAWTTIGAAEVSDANGMGGEDTAAIMFKGKTLGEIYPSDTSMIHVDTTSSYLKWLITVDTTMLEDTITKDSPGARNVEMDDNRYMVRATPVVDGSLPENPNENPVAEGETYTEMFSVDNDDDVTPLGPTNVEVTSVDAMYPVFEDNGDGSYTVGGLVDKYDHEVSSPVITLTLTPTAERNTYASVKLLTSLPEGAIIGDITETAEGSGVFTVTIDVGTLMDDDDPANSYNDRYLEDSYHENPMEFIYNPKGEVFMFTVHALAYDKAMPYDDVTAADEVFLEYGNIQADEYEDDEITVSVQNSYRPDPGVIAVTVENSDGMVNPDSGAWQGVLTFNVYTYYITSAPTEGIRVEVMRPVDETWERITGTAIDPVGVDISELEGIADLDDITGGLIGITQAGAISSGESEVGIPTQYMKWQFMVDTRELALEGTDAPENTIKLDDTIERGDAAERDASLDDNQYVVRAISLTPKNPAQNEYHQRDGVEASFSLDNVDDVPPLGPTNITDVADHVGSLVANEDGSFTARGIVDPSVESTKVTFTIEPTADPMTYAGGKTVLVQTAPDGTVTEEDGSLDEGSITVDIGQLANGMYMYHALVADEFGNVQVQGEADMPSPVVTVHVLNFRVSDIMDLMVTSVDGVAVDGELPERIPLRESIAVSFNVNNGTLFVDDLTGVYLDGHGVTFMAGGEGNAFSLSASDLMSVTDGWYTPHGRVTIRERYVDFPLAMINLDNTGPMITIETPAEGHTVNDLPTLLAGFGDGDLGSGVSADNTAVVSLARLRPEEVDMDAVPIDVDQSMVEQDMDSVVYTRIDKLAGGAYMFTVQVSDILGNVGETSVNFAVEGLNPTVVITAPASGQEFDASPASVTGFFAGGGDVSISKFTVNDVDVSESVMVDGNNFTYMPADGFSEDDHAVAVEVMDENGLTAQTALTFTVMIPGPSVAILSPAAGQMYDHGMPSITVESSGVSEPVTVSVMVNGEAAMMNDDGTYSPASALGDGEHTVMATATDSTGKTAEATVIFSVEIPGPSVAILSPAAGQMYDHGMPVITVESSGVAAPVSESVMVNGEAAAMNDDGTYSPASALGDGEHTVMATATDANGKTAEATVIFSVEIPGPSVAILSPAAGQMYDHGMPVITVESSGVAAPVSESVMVNGEAAAMNDDGTYSPASALGDGEHTVMATATDANGKTAEATVIFSVEIPGPSIAIHSPAPGQMYNHDMPNISWEVSGMAEPVSVSLTLNGDAVELADGAVSYTPEDGIGEGEHTVVATATDANGKMAEATTVFTVEFPMASVMILSPTAGHTYNNGTPIVSGEFTGVGEVTVKLTVDGKEVDPEINGNGFTYTPDPALGHGNHTVAVEVTDANGESAMTSSEFIVDIPGPSVAILSPAHGQTYEHGEPVIRAEFSGMTDVEVSTFTINGEDVELGEDAVEDNQLAYTPTTALVDGEHTVVVEVTDTNGKTARDVVVFAVAIPKDTTAPIISEVSPSGMVRLNEADVLAENMAITISAVIVEEQSSITNVEYSIDDGPRSTYPVERATSKFEITESFSPGPHSITLSVSSEGGTRVHSWQFVLEVDKTAPIISSITPAGTIHAGLPTISASATDASGVQEITIVVMDSNGEEVNGDTSDDAEDRTNEGITRLDFHPEAPLSEGTYSIEVRATDTFGNSSTSKGGFTIDFDTAAPIITSSSPQNGARLMYNHDEEARPVISVTFADAESGINPDSIRLVIEYPQAGGGSQAQPINLTDDQMSATQVIYTPAAPAFPRGFDVAGQYTVTLEVSDNAHQEGNVSDESDGARMSNMAVYKFTFSVEHMDAPVLKTVFNFPNPFESNTRISFGLNQMSTVSIVIYDSTQRPVRTLRDNVIMSAGNYTGQNGIGWDGKSSNGEELARGIYYCQIIVTGGFEPEYAILKLALTR
ncbi:hypothetical protein F4212_01515 [Candidatus Poribacteria bacterium]|nr:hypothetical protein [Candidatus Poribacteria bacterium]